VVCKGPGGQCTRCPSWCPSHIPAPSGPSLGHVSGEVRVYPAGGAAAGRGIYSKMTDAKNISTKEEGAKSEPHGPLTGLLLGDDAVPDPDTVAWLLPYTESRYLTRTTPIPVPEGYYLLMRHQCRQGVIGDRCVMLKPQNQTQSQLSAVTHFKG